MEILKIEKLSFSYPNNSVLENLDLSIEKGTFNIICGSTGCGKTTLLRLLKNEIRPRGQISGKILYNDFDLFKLDRITSTSKIGYVFQNPDNQIISDKVYSELAFGLENLGIERSEMKRRIAEISSFFGIESLFSKDTMNLSGGEKQLVNLASVMVMEPEILLLDEPTSQLDPIAAYNFLRIIKKINEELGTTILIVEHKMEDILSLADKLIILDNKKIVANDSPREVCEKIKKEKINISSIFNFPASFRIYKEFNNTGEAPLSVNEGRMYITNNFKNKVSSLNKKEVLYLNNIIELKNVSFKYNKNDDYILNDLSLTIKQGEVFSIVGGNGVGKSTLLNIIAGNIKPLSGKIIIDSKKITDYKKNELYKNNIVFLPQNPDDLFICDNVYDELKEMNRINVNDDFPERLNNVIEDLQLSHLLNKHPYDLSGGEKQKVAIGKILLLNPKIILLDEVSKGLDGENKQKLIKLIKSLQNKQITIVLVTHDLEFSSLVSNRCGILFNGDLMSVSNTTDFYSTNNFYTTAVSRMTKVIYNKIITVEDAISILKENEI